MNVLLDKTMLTLPETCTTREAAKRLNVALSTVQTWVESGYLEAWKTPGGHRRIPISSINKLLQTGMAQRAIDQPKPFKILIVEDEAGIRLIYEELINSWKLPIVVALADNGYDGLVMAASVKPDLLITDLAMPELDGVKMIMALRNGEETSKLTILAVTGLDAAEIEQRGGLPTDIKVLLKPIDFKMLHTYVVGLMASQNRFSRLSTAASANLS